MNASRPHHPTKPQSITARRLAFQALFLIDKKRLFADLAFDRVLGNHVIAERDRALAFELVQGVLRHKTFLDWRLNTVSNKPLQGLPLPVAIILRLGAFQILCLTQIPNSAAVNEAVNLAKTIKGRDWSGFVNGVLRALTRQPAPSWPDPSCDPAAALALRYSCPEWLTKRWISQYGLQGADHACRATITVPPLTCRVNTLHCSRDTLMAELKERGIHAHPTSISPVGLTIEKSGSLQHFTPLQSGSCYIEDEAAQLVPLLLDVQPGHRVLDACAAPGGKTTHIAALMNNQGTILATDASSRRLRILQDNCVRLGATIVHPMLVDYETSPEVPLETLLPAPPRGTALTFDRILVDAPCSGLGVLGRHPEGKWFKTPDDLLRLQRLQRRILNRVSVLLRPGGVLVYSACSGEPEETGAVIGQFCRDHPEFSHEAATPWLPPAARSFLNQDGDLLTMASPLSLDGFFAARLRKDKGNAP